jgi:hypothetical protein
VVPFYRRHPAILMWSLGSEWNLNGYFQGWSVEISAQRTEVAARLVKTLDTAHPVASSYGEIDRDAAGARLADTARYVNEVTPTPDVWSLNLFRGNSFDSGDNVSAFAQWASISAKPVFVGEFGVDAFHGRCLSNPPSGSVNEAQQAAWTLDLWHDVRRNLSAGNRRKVALGGTVFEWNDEWWKVPPSGSQQTGGWTSDGFPDWHGTEEYFGIVDIDRTPRAVYAALAAAFAPAHVPPPHAVTFRAISRGANLCGAQADFRRDGYTFYQRFGGGGGGRGFNVAVVNPTSGDIVDRGRNFDTWGGGDAAKQTLVDYLAGIADGQVVMLAVADEAGLNVGTSCSIRTDAPTVAVVQALQTMGSTRITEYCWRGSWAMVTIKGTGVALDEAYHRTEEARAEHPLPVSDEPDTDGDGLPDWWEGWFGLDPHSASGDDGRDGDPDRDGLPNLTEFGEDTHPRGHHTRYLAEGATSAFFETRLALLNPGDAALTAVLRFLRAGKAPIGTVVDVPARTRTTVDAKTVPGLATAEFSTIVESDRPLVVDRTMSWSAADAYGAHGETAVPGPALRWYLAEGATHSGFDLFYLLQNPNPTEAQVRVRFLRPNDAPLENTYTLGADSRTNIWVNVEEFPELGAALASAEVSAVIESLNGVPIIVERAMYLDIAGQMFGAGHESAGVTAPATEWFLAEGATGPFFDLFVLIANPGNGDALVEATYLLPGGATIIKQHRVAANSRFNIWVDHEDVRLADTAVSTTIESTNGVPIVVERAMWWPDGGWYEAHNSPAANLTGTKWAMAEGEIDAARNLETYVLVANTTAAPADVKVTLLFEDGTTAEQLYGGIPAKSRFNVPVGAFFPLAAGKRFGILIESVGAAPAEIVVERAIYWDAAGQRWAAGTNALATRLR